MKSIGSTGITLLKQLDYLDLGYNKISGPIPKWLGNITLTGVLSGELGLSFNQFTGPFARELCNIKPALFILFLESNKLNGPIPAAIGNFTQLQILDVGYKKMSGPLPHELGKLKNLQKLFAGNNQLTGPLPKELGNLRNLEEIDISHDKITGPIPSTYGGTFYPSLDGLHFTNNMRTGIENSGRMSILPLIFLPDFSVRF